jgi:hypothetical protein
VTNFKQRHRIGVRDVALRGGGAARAAVRMRARAAAAGGTIARNRKLLQRGARAAFAAVIKKDYAE